MQIADKYEKNVANFNKQKKKENAFLHFSEI
jgi:hypothetical protein